MTDAQTWPENVTDMVEDFTFLDDWEDRYMHVIDMGKALPPLLPEEKTDATKVKGCVSQVWLITERRDGKFYFRGDSDAHIVKGLVAIVLKLYSGRTSSEIQSLDAQPVLAKLGLSEHLSPQRSNGLQAMILRIKHEANS